MYTHCRSVVNRIAKAMYQHSNVMKSRKRAGWRPVAAAIAGLVLLAACADREPRTDPWDFMPAVVPHTDHTSLIKGPFADGPAVTRRCLECHPEAGSEVLGSTHFTWLSDEAEDPLTGEVRAFGKLNLLNNFCVSIAGNWERCTSCHAGYGWRDNSFDFTDPESVDCLVCHDLTGGYVKDPNGAGLPAEGVDLAASARSVGRPTRANCGACHFNGGGGDAVKHGDLDMTMKFPGERLDVHMGGLGFECVDCHRTTDHVIGGHLPSISNPKASCISCGDCHGSAPHRNERLNSHVASVACQTCHIPEFAIDTPTKMSWDWSTAGRDEEPAEEYFAPDKEHHYEKIKGSFVYEDDLVPEYIWYTETVTRNLPGQVIDPDGLVMINDPQGAIGDPAAKIWPFKVHAGRQVYDTEYNYLLRAKTYGEGGFWTEFDWDRALRLGEEAGGLPYSGHYGFVETRMYWPITHMVQPAAAALQCTDCHNDDDGRLDWTALGYRGDPLTYGGRGSAGSVLAMGGPDG